MQKRNRSIRKLAITGIMTALGYVLMLFQLPLPFMPAFIQLDFSDLPALLTAFACGPLWGVAVSFLKNLLHLLNSATLGIGELSNFIIAAVFVLTAGLIYQKNKTKKGALVASLAGALASGVLCVFTNYFLIYPLYFKFLMPEQAILGMYQEKLSSVNGIFLCLVIFNLPFTFFKELLVAVICFLIYMPLSPILHGKRKG
jgi:riboflavin transporter FmnP